MSFDFDMTVESVEINFHGSTLYAPAKIPTVEDILRKNLDRFFGDFVMDASSGDVDHAIAKLNFITKAFLDEAQNRRFIQSYMFNWSGKSFIVTYIDHNSVGKRFISWDLSEELVATIGPKSDLSEEASPDFMDVFEDVFK